jgi:hypothetical protein
MGIKNRTHATLNILACWTLDIPNIVYTSILICAPPATSLRIFKPAFPPHNPKDIHATPRAQAPVLRSLSRHFKYGFDLENLRCIVGAVYCEDGGVVNASLY